MNYCLSEEEGGGANIVLCCLLGKLNHTDIDGYTRQTFLNSPSLIQSSRKSE